MKPVERFFKQFLECAYILEDSIHKPVIIKKTKVCILF